MHESRYLRRRHVCGSNPAAFLVPLALAAIYLISAPLLADEACKTCPQPRAQDEIWLISNRGACCDVEKQTANLRYWHYDREKSWVPASLDELLATDDPQVVTTVFVHGNRIPSCEAFTKGWIAYRALVRCADERPVRFIIWSWPSERICGPVRDAREKAGRTNPSGFCLAWFLDRLDPEVPVSLWAHSFGARIVTGALHLLGGGEFGGYHLSERKHAARQPMQVALIVAALDNDWLLPGRFHGQAMSQVGGLLLVNNCCDVLLKRYHVIHGRHCCQEALGYTGAGARGISSADWSKISQINACSAVGRRHTFAGYISVPSLVASMRSCLLFETRGESAEAEATVAARGDAPVE